MMKSFVILAVLLSFSHAGMFDSMQKSMQDGWDSAKEVSEEAMESETGKKVKKGGEKVYEKAKKYGSKAWQGAKEQGKEMYEEYKK